MDPAQPLSLDENSLCQRSLNLTQAQLNLNRLQEHVRKTFSKHNYIQYKAEMATSLTGGWQDSVNDEELYGEGRAHYSYQNIASSTKEDAAEESLEIGTVVLPVFDVLEGPSGGPRCTEKSSSNIPANETCLNEYIDTGSDMPEQGEGSFKNVFRNKRSTSASERRKRFSEPSSPLLELAPTLSRSISNSSCPSVTEKSENSDSSIELQKSLQHKELIEGKSTMCGKSNQKHFVRTVSINEEANTYISPKDDKQLKDLEDRKHVCSESDVKRDQWRKSSGYGTGDSDSSTADKRLESQSSQGGVSDVSSTWLSSESNCSNVNDNTGLVDCMLPETEGNMVNAELFEHLRSITGTVSSQGDDSYVSDDKSFSEQSVDTLEKSYGSSLDTGTSMISTIQDSYDGKRQTSSEVAVNIPRLEILPLRSQDDQYPDTGQSELLREPKSAGNMPTIIGEESFSIQASQVEKVQEEDEKQINRLREQLSSKECSPESLVSEVMSPETPLSQESQFYRVCNLTFITFILL